MVAAKPAFGCLFGHSHPGPTEARRMPTRESKCLMSLLKEIEVATRQDSNLRL